MQCKIKHKQQNMGLTVFRIWTMRRSSDWNKLVAIQHLHLIFWRPTQPDTFIVTHRIVKEQFTRWLLPINMWIFVSLTLTRDWPANMRISVSEHSNTQHMNSRKPLCRSLQFFLDKQNLALPRLPSLRSYHPFTTIWLCNKPDSWHLDPLSEVV